MNDFFDQIKEYLPPVLNKLSSDTEKIFIKLANNYPLLLEELKANLLDAEEAIQDFKNTEGISGGKVSQISSIIEKTKKRIEKANSTFTRIHSQDDVLFKQLDESFSHINSLEDLINDIIEDSKKMELISINAMTVALKSGKEGGAFSYITEELKRIASRTIVATEQLTQKREHLKKLFTDFKGSTANIANFQKSLFESFDKRINNSFDEFYSGISEIVEKLSYLVNKSKTIKDPLFKIMEEIQQQDIIRQSIDHVGLSISEIASFPEDADEEYFLDELSYIKAVPDLCTKVLNDITRYLRKSHKIFNKNTKISEKIINETEREGDNLLFQISNDNIGSKSLLAIFESSANMLKQLIADIEHSMHLKERVNNENRSFMKEIEGMEENLKSFSILVGRFNNINVAARIEVSKQAILSDMTSTVKEMVEITDHIEARVKTALKETKKFIKGIAATINEYNNIYLEEEIFVDSFIFNINKDYKNLCNSKHLIESKINSFSIFKGKFSKLFNESKTDINKISDIKYDIEKLIKTLFQIGEMANIEIKKILDSRNETEWKIRNQKLKDIIDRFTIFTHKKAAGDIGNFVVEETKQTEGDLTLF